jgi:hypothetical protein
MSIRVMALPRPTMSQSGPDEAMGLQNLLGDAHPGSRLVQVLDASHDLNYRIAIFQTEG